MYSTMKLLIAGSRNFKDYDQFKRECDLFLRDMPAPITIISGGAPGTDTMAEKYAKENNIPISLFIPDWKTHGRSAGAIRNAAMVQQATHCLVFWDGLSLGTAITIKQAQKNNLPIKIIHTFNSNSNIS